MRMTTVLLDRLGPCHLFDYPFPDPDPDCATKIVHHETVFVVVVLDFAPAVIDGFFGVDVSFGLPSRADLGETLVWSSLISSLTSTGPPMKHGTVHPFRVARLCRHHLRHHAVVTGPDRTLLDAPDRFPRRADFSNVDDSDGGLCRGYHDC